MQCIRLTISLPILLCNLAYADISTDGSVGPAQTLNANNGQYTIGQELGSLRGSNLFHSFQQFNINTGESATFTGNNTIQNVISRVTGGSVSNINGILRSEIGNADFYFINPAGVIFGQHAQVDVPAAFHVSTAGELKFTDGASFSAINPEASSLTIAEPQGFGFTQGQTGKLQIIGGQLSFKLGTDVSLSANSLSITDIELSSGESQQAAITVQQSDPATEQGIHLNLTAVDTETSQIIPVNGLAETATGGELHIANSLIDSSGNGFGQIAIRASDVTLENSLLFADNTGDLNMSAGNGIDVNVQSLVLDHARLSNDVRGKGNANTVIVKASEAVQVLNGGRIHSVTFSDGDAGNVTVEAGEVLIDRQGSESLTGIFSVAVSGLGNSGTVLVSASEAVQVLNGGRISSKTFSDGDAGSVTVEGREVQVDGQGSESVTGITNDASPDSQGNAGTVLVSASVKVQVLNGGRISSITYGDGDAGSVTVEAREVLVDGQGSESATGIASETAARSQGNVGAVIVSAGDKVQVLNEGRISSITYGDGDAGSVTVETGEVLVSAGEKVQVLNGGRISSITYGDGDAGSVTVEAGELLVDRQGSGSATGIASEAATGSKGDAGAVLVSVGEKVQVLNGGSIYSSTFSNGNAGSVTVEAGEVLIDRQGSESATGIASYASAGSQGNAGTLLVSANEAVQVLNGGRISSKTVGDGNAGSVTVEGGEVLVDGRGSIFSNVSPDGQVSQGNAGMVLISASESVKVLNGGRIHSSTSGGGDAGSVTVEAGDVLIDGQGKHLITGISSSTLLGQGNVGTVLVRASKAVQVLNGGSIRSSALSDGNAGNVIVEAGEVLVDGQEVGVLTGISSVAAIGQGNAGGLLISASESVKVLNGGRIHSSTSGGGDAGSVTVEAREVLIDGQESETVTGITSDAAAGSEGNAGTVLVSVSEAVQVLNGGTISSTTFSDGDAGSVTVEAGYVLIDGQGSESATNISSDAVSGSRGDAGAVLVRVSEAVQVQNGGGINSLSYGDGGAGSVTVEAGEVLIDGQESELVTGIFSDTAFGQSHAGAVLVSASEAVQVQNGGRISSLTFGGGDAGSVTVVAGEVFIDREGSGSLTGISSDAAEGSSGDAGTVLVSASVAVRVLNGGRVSSLTYGGGDAGSVTVVAGEVFIDREGGGSFTGITSDALAGSQGDAGGVLVSASEKVQVLNGGRISSTTFNDGDAGSVMVEAREVLVDGQRSVGVTGIFSDAQGSQGDAGGVLVSASEAVQVLSGGTISSTTVSDGDAGSVTVEAREVLIDGRGSESTTGIASDATSVEGKAGTVLVSASEAVQVLNGGRVSSLTFGDGNAGSVTVEAREVLIDGRGSESTTGISSDAGFGESHAGTVLVSASEAVQVLNGGRISSTTFDSGDAGSVMVEAGEVLIDRQGSEFVTGIFSTSAFYATGQVGSVSIEAKNQIIVRDGAISIASENDQLQLFTNDSATLAELNINTPILQLEQNSSIDATAKGGVNAAAIEIKVADSINIENSQISTSAVNGNGGSITINADSWLQLQQSQITTSVLGLENGNGGNININTPVTILDTGFIQANTAASQAQGGDIILNVSQLIPSGNILLVGGEESLTFDPEQPNFNVIQAASRDGVNGKINISSPELNITGALVSISIPELNLERLGQDPCTRQRENSLKNLGHGGVPALQHGENYLQINRQEGMDKKPSDRQPVSQTPEASITHLSKQSIFTDCAKQQHLSLSQVGG